MVVLFRGQPPPPPTRISRKNSYTLSSLDWASQNIADRRVSGALLILAVGPIVLAAWTPRREAGPADQETAPPYLGQTPPGLTPEPFAHHILTRELHSSPVFSPRGDEVFWNEMEGGWSDPEFLGSPVNDYPMHWGVALASNGNLYFGHTEGSEDLFSAELRDGIYRDPVPLGEGVNSEHLETTPCVAPDESWLVFSRVVDHGRGPIDLYVSFRTRDGGWTEAVPLEGVNTPEREISPRLSPDGEYLFFLRTLNGELRPYWVRSSVITDLVRQRHLP